jgi:hypothetical protein
MSDVAQFEQDEPVTVVIHGQVDHEVTLWVAGREWEAAGVKYGPDGSFQLTVPVGMDGVEVRREAAPPAEPELVARALRDAILLYETGHAGDNCPACLALYWCDQQCSEHDRNGPTATAYRDLLARLEN